MDLGLAGKRALVTGASKGIGRAIAEALAAEGAAVTICARGGAALAAAADAMRGRGARVEAVAADLATDGGVDVLVNNVTGPAGGLDVLGTTDADWLDAFAMNVLVHVRFVRRALPGMLARGWGRIVNIASTSARQPDEHYPAYGATKAALLHLSKLLANVYSGRGVLTNCVCPGITRTEAAAASAVRRT